MDFSIQILLLHNSKINVIIQLMNNNLMTLLKHLVIIMVCLQNKLFNTIHWIIIEDLKH